MPAQPKRNVKTLKSYSNAYGVVGFEEGRHVVGKRMARLDACHAEKANETARNALEDIHFENGALRCLPSQRETSKL